MAKKAKPESSANESIFPNSQITPLAIKWKQLNASGRHKEAMVVLEQIIKGSTEMFERVALCKDYHYTVDIGILISAAQEKVIKWLLKWKPKSGRLYSFFTKSVSGDTRVLCEDLIERRIDVIVDNKLPINVISWNTDKAIFEPKPVTGWIKGKAYRKLWRKLTVNHPAGFTTSFFATGDHEVLTQRGWVEIDSLKELDYLFLRFLATIDSIEIKIVPCTWKVRPITEFDTSNFEWKYDITVADNFNFIAEGCIVHNCAINAFKSELVKVNQFRKRYHTTSDDLERFYGTEDHAVDKHDCAQELHNRLAELTCRWGDPQEIGTIRYLTLCIIDDDHDKHASIRSASYAYGLSVDQCKYFYAWSVVNLRHAFYDKVYVPFTEHDLLLAAESYTFWPEIVNIVGIDKAKELSAKMGGTRCKIPTLQYIATLRENYRMFRDIQGSDQDPEAVADIAKKYGKTSRTAQEIFYDMVEKVDSKRYGEYGIFNEDGADA